MAVESATAATHIPAGRIWRYFAGICWRILSERRERAAAILAEQRDPCPSTCSAPLIPAEV